MPANEGIAVLDLEFTTWEGSWESGWSGPGEEKEVVQIGAVRLANDDALTETDAFEVLVKPRINPVLSDYFIRLTGITQVRLESDGLDFADGLEALRRFLGDDTGAVYSYGGDGNILRRDCEARGLDFPFPAGLFFDARDLMARHISKEVAAVESNKLPEALGFPPPGDSHQAVNDCRCIAEALRILRRKGLF